MTKIIEPRALPSYALSSVHCEPRRGDLLVVAKSSEGDASRGTQGKTFSSLHFRDAQPSVQYTVTGSQLFLNSLGTNSCTTELEFGSSIRDVGVHDDSVNLMVHVFMDNLVLYSMILTPAYLEDPHMEKSPGWIIEYLAPSFQIRNPLYMHSISAVSIIFALQDGGLLRLTNNGRGYNEHVFSDSSYFTSFKSILPWSGRPSNLIISMQASPAKNLLYTISVDARLKIWDISTGRLLAAYNTFMENHPPNFLSEPVRSNFITSYEHQFSTIVVTYCPHLPGIFKIFKGRGIELEEISSFNEQQPAEGLWRVFDMTVSTVRPDGSLILHVLWKSDTLMIVQTAFASLHDQTINWQFSSSPDTAQAMPSSSVQMLEEYVFRPGRFSVRTLQEALASLLKTSNTLPSDSSLESTQSAIRKCINHAVELKIDADTGNELQEEFQEEVRLKLLNFAQICHELDRAACEPHAIRFSPSTQEVLIVQSGKISFIREATSLEKNLERSTVSQEQQSPLSDVLRAALVLRDGLSVDSWQLIAETLQQECILDRTVSADDAMFLMYEKTIEDQLPPATISRLSLNRLSTSHIVAGFNEIRTNLSIVPAEYTIDGILGLDAYVAAQISAYRVTRETLVILVIYLLYTSCTNEEADLYQISKIYIEYLEIFRQVVSIEETLKCQMSLDSERVGKVLTKDLLRRNKSLSCLVFYELAASTRSGVLSRDFLERTLILLINSEQGALAVHFCKFAQDTPLLSYLQARSLLLNGDVSKAATLFARCAGPLIQSTSTKLASRLLVEPSQDDLISYFLHVADLFSAAAQPLIAVRFYDEAILSCNCATTTTTSPASVDRKENIQRRKLVASLEAKDWYGAYNSVYAETFDTRKENLTRFLTSIAESGESELIADLPFVGLVEEVDAVLEQKARNMLDVRLAPSYHQLLYSFRVQHADYRGAASILYHKLQFLRNRSHVNGFNKADYLQITEGYLAIINAMRCLNPDDAWMIVGTFEQDVPASKKSKIDDDEARQRSVFRKVLKLEDVRAEYNKELRNLEAQLIELAKFGQ